VHTHFNWKILLEGCRCIYMYEDNIKVDLKTIGYGNRLDSGLVSC
jgi:hypothetical protein